MTQRKEALNIRTLGHSEQTIPLMVTPKRTKVVVHNEKQQTRVYSKTGEVAGLPQTCCLEGVDASEGGRKLSIAVDTHLSI